MARSPSPQRASAARPRAPRNTPQGAAVRRVFAEADGPLSVQDARERAERLCPGIGIATVYRTLRRLLAEKAVAAVDIPGAGVLYEAAAGLHHHYFVCHACGRAFVLRNCPGHLQAMVPDGFELQRHDIVLHGLCAGCRTSQA